MRSLIETYRRLRRKRVPRLEIIVGLGVSRVVDSGQADSERYESFSIERIAPVGEVRISDRIWICFPGLGQPDGAQSRLWHFLRRRLLPDDGELFVFHGPAAIAGYSPQQCIDATLAVERAVNAILDCRNGRPVGIFCFSAGTHLGFYLANEIAKRLNAPIEKLVAVAPGESIAYGIYSTWVTDGLARSLVLSGITRESYDRDIGRFTQRNNIERLPSGNDLVIHAGSADTFIPLLKREGTASLVRLLRVAGKKPVYRVHKGKNHASLVLRLILLKIVGRDPYLLRPPEKHPAQAINE